MHYSQKLLRRFAVNKQKCFPCMIHNRLSTVVTVGKTYDLIVTDKVWSSMPILLSLYFDQVHFVSSVMPFYLILLYLYCKAKITFKNNSHTA